VTRAFLLDTAGNTLGALDTSYRTLNTLRSWWDVDTFALVIDRRRKYADAIEEGTLLYLPDEGASGELYLVEQITYTQDGNTDEMNVSGRSLDGIALAERLVLPPAGLDYDEVDNLPAETAMKHYVNAHAGPGAVDPNRRIPGLAIEADAARGIRVTTQGRYQTVADLERQIGLLSGLGWSIEPSLPGFTFKVLAGVDRSTSVIFSFEYDTLDAWSELASLMDSKQVAYVAGQGEGAARDLVVRGTGAGFARREAFIDARDVDLGRTDILTSRGDAFLATAGVTHSYETRLHAYGAFRYRRDWDCGDLVLLMNASRGISDTVRIVTVAATFDQSAEVPTIVAGIDRPFPTLKDRVAGSTASTASVTADSGSGGGGGGTVPIVGGNLADVIVA
jgi:hypothetical protein